MTKPTLSPVVRALAVAVTVGALLWAGAILAILIYVPAHTDTVVTECGRDHVLTHHGHPTSWQQHCYLDVPSMHQGDYWRMCNTTPTTVECNDWRDHPYQ